MKLMTLYQNQLGNNKNAGNCLLQPPCVSNGNQHFYQALWGHREHSYKVLLNSAQAPRSSLTHRQTLGM